MIFSTSINRYVPDKSMPPAETICCTWNKNGNKFILFCFVFYFIQFLWTLMHRFDRMSIGFVFRLWAFGCFFAWKTIFASKIIHFHVSILSTQTDAVSQIESTRSLFIYLKSKKYSNQKFCNFSLNKTNKKKNETKVGEETRWKVEKKKPKWRPHKNEKWIIDKSEQSYQWYCRIKCAMW